MLVYRWIIAAVAISLGVFLITLNSPVNAIGWECVRDANHIKNGVKDGVNCTVTVSGNFATIRECEDVCNRLCARGFSPACNFTSVCKVYGFAINLMSVGAGLVALMVLLYGAYRYVMGKGVAEEISKAQAILINAGIGLVLVVVAYSLTRLVLALLQVDTVCF